MTGKPRGGDGNGDGAAVPRQRGRSGDKVPASVAEGQSQVAEDAGDGRGSGSGGGPVPGIAAGTGVGSPISGPPFKVVDGVVGPAKGKSLSLPNKRHTVSGSRSGEVKDPTSVYLRGYEGVAREDVAQIAAGKAMWVKEIQCYEINDRFYRVHDGTAYPVSGDGVVKLSGHEYAALKAIAQADGDPAKAPQLIQNPRFRNHPEYAAKAKQIYDGTYEP